MRLSDYQWSHNPRGMHNKEAPQRMDLSRLSQMRMGWAKLVAIAGEYVKDVAPMLASNITPIVRIWRPRFGAGTPAPDMVTEWKNYVAAGAKWFEYYNEPNLEIEWPRETPPHYANTAGIVAPLMTNWLAWAEQMIELGAYPAFPALAESSLPHEDAVAWLTAMLTFLADYYYDRFRAVADNGLWVATHPYFYNHFYQEAGRPNRPRPPEQQNSAEGGWHFEYPYDPITQSDHPGLTTISGGAEKPRGDPVGLIGMGDAFMKKYQEMFGGGAVPVVGTEGGIYPVPGTKGDIIQRDGRFPPYTWNSHAEATVAMFNWIANRAPPWMFGVTLWKEDSYFEATDGPARAVQRMAEVAPAFKNVPPIEALNGPGPRALVGGKGPGPIHGAPDFHFLVVAPGFNTNWFFGHLREYWERFRPTVTTSVDFFAFIPYSRSLAVTVLATPETADYMAQQIKSRWATVWIDLISAAREEDIAAVLRDRVSTGRRFG